VSVLVANKSRKLKLLLGYAGIIAVTLVILDLALVLLGLFPPRHDYGHSELGWVPAIPTGTMESITCVEHSSGDTATYVRNEEGVRTRLSVVEFATSAHASIIAVTGDSQTDLCAPDSQTHPGVLEATLAKNGVEAVVVSYGAGGYSPLQDYLAFKLRLARYGPDVMVMNLYTGNDFYDILRVDDRPHFVRADTGYAIAPPVWYRLDEPGTRRSSRVLFALRSVAEQVGVHGVLTRVQVLHAVVAEQGMGLPSVVAYINDLRRSTAPELGYPGALSAQMLNQQLFFHRFPAVIEESVRRLRALLALARQEYPDLVLVLSPIPSYQLVQEQPVDSVLLRTIARLPITYEEGLRQERALYDTLATLAAESGWLFVDNLAALRAHEGPERLFNDFDYHLLPVASEIIGTAQADALKDYLQSRPGRQEGAAVVAAPRREAR
jgi:hypothetical protein